MSTYVPEFIYGGSDGIMTTAAVVGGAYAIGLSNPIIVGLGLANVLGDCVSIGISRYLSVKTENSKVNPIKSGLATGISFILLGLMPILPFLLNIRSPFVYSIIFTIFALLIVSYIKNKQTNSQNSLQQDIFETVSICLLGILVAYSVGLMVR
jgi:vacuolar iron transporter family protein